MKGGDDMSMLSVKVVPVCGSMLAIFMDGGKETGDSILFGTMTRADRTLRERGLTPVKTYGNSVEMLYV